MAEPTYLGHPILPDIAHVDIKTSYKTYSQIIFKIFSRVIGFPIAITGMDCAFEVRFENVYEKVSPPLTFEWRIVKDESHRYWNIKDVKIQKKGDIDYKHFKYLPETSGYHKLFIKVPVSEEGNWKVGFHKKNLHFEDGFDTRFRVYSKREIFGMIGVIFTILGVIFKIMGLGLL